jgi:hypothetical protein
MPTLGASLWLRPAVGRTGTARQGRCPVDGPAGFAAGPMEGARRGSRVRPGGVMERPASRAEESQPHAEQPFRQVSPHVLLPANDGPSQPCPKAGYSTLRQGHGRQVGKTSKPSAGRRREGHGSAGSPAYAGHGGRERRLPRYSASVMALPFVVRVTDGRCRDRSSLKGTSFSLPAGPVRVMFGPLWSNPQPSRWRLGDTRVGWSPRAGSRYLDFAYYQAHGCHVRGPVCLSLPGYPSFPRRFASLPWRFAPVIYHARRIHEPVRRPAAESIQRGGKQRPPQGGSRCAPLAPGCDSCCA